jgi:hypothetical protein
VLIWMARLRSSLVASGKWLSAVVESWTLVANSSLVVL